MQRTSGRALTRSEILKGFFTKQYPYEGMGVNMGSPVDPQGQTEGLPRQGVQGSSDRGPQTAGRKEPRSQEAEQRGPRAWPQRPGAELSRHLDSQQPVCPEEGRAAAPKDTVQLEEREAFLPTKRPRSGHMAPLPVASWCNPQAAGPRSRKKFQRNMNWPKPSLVLTNVGNVGQVKRRGGEQVS